MLKEHINPDGTVVNARIGSGAVIESNAWISSDAVIESNARIDNDAVIGRNAWIGSGARIGNDAVIGRNARIGIGARIDNDAVIGRNAWIGSGARIETRDHYVMIGYRKDGYGFTMYVTEGVVRVVAGCRDFTHDEAVAHWSSPEYDDRKLGDETLVMIRGGMDVLKIRGVTQ